MKPLDRPLLKHHQIQDLEEEKQQLTAALSSSNPFRSKISKPQLMYSRLKSIDKLIETSAPTKLPGDEQDKLAKLEVELRSAWTQGMPTEEEMRKNPAGMVARHQKWEKANKAVILKWKNVRRQLEPESEDPDLANIETFRPAGVLDRMVANAQIPGAMNFRSVPSENWNAAFGEKGPDSALEQAKRVRRELTEEQKEAARQRLVLARERKKQLHEQASERVEVPALSEG